VATTSLRTEMTSSGFLPYELVTGPSSIFCRARSRIAVMSAVKLPAAAA
jgi:hypothetical protein